MPRSALPSPLPQDPLGAYGLPAVISGTRTPVPLVGTSFAVTIDAGMALVTTTRRFRNAEDQSIEVTMTFPVPVHATLFDLVARIGQRNLRARAQSRTQARDTYEDSIDQGRTAVLHEEVLRGVHQLSVAHVPPGAEIEVEASWAMTLAAVPGGGMLHIPVTVGDVYGRSPLPDSDDLCRTAEVQTADLAVECREGIVALTGGTLSHGRAKLRLDAPIRLTITRWRSRMLRGVAADGRGVGIEIAPAAVGSLTLDAAILVDRSGSMEEAASGLLPSSRNAKPPRTKHEVVLAGLLEAAAVVGSEDRIDLWEFDNAANMVPGEGFTDAVRRLSAPEGGTETGAAVRAVLAGRPTRDVLLITDGKSHALDVHAAAMSGRRFHVVLIGEDSLEAHVGHLAALSGGQLFIAAGLEAGGMIRRAIEAMRLPQAAPAPITGAPTTIEANLGGMDVRAAWWDREKPAPGLWSRSVAAVATALALPRMSEDDAAALAAAEGIVCHLTSLVLVDEADETQDGLPAQRRIGMGAPQVAAMRACMIDFPAEPTASRLPPAVASETPKFLRRPGSSGGYPSSISSEPLHPDVPSYMRRTTRDGSLRSQLGRVDWMTDPEALRRADLWTLPLDVAEMVRKAAQLPEVITAAASLGMEPIVLVLALLADAESISNRPAKRFARAVLGKSTASSFGRFVFRKGPAQALAAAAKAIGL